DNISFTVIKVNDASSRPKQDLARPSMAITRPKRLTTLATEPMLLPLQLHPEGEGMREEIAPPGQEPATEAQVTPRRVATQR
ncbi:hypothetical protein, partial [Tabrizicola sp.]|uniref:hypothetical protein n=1 Tax=Tabrizicola sp. TaxID=2005166 RepID=UPI0035B444CF